MSTKDQAPQADDEYSEQSGLSSPESPTALALSGRQFEIGFGEQRATIVEVGGGIRAYRDGQRDVLHPYPVGAMSDGAHGAVLVPWPNRLRDGSYRFDGSDYQLALTEPEKRNAIHGLLRWRPWQVAGRDSNQVTMATTLHPMQGYPFYLDLQVNYSLDQHGLTVRTTATNVGSQLAPYGCGQHPYLSPGAGDFDACTLTFDVGTRILTDPERQLPTGTEPVPGTGFDFRSGRTIGELEIDYAFTDLARDRNRRAWVGLQGIDGDTARIWVDEGYPFLEIYTADTLAPDRRRRGLGVEPMTCPPDAFNSGDHVVQLEPGQSITTAWGALLERSSAVG